MAKEATITEADAARLASQFGLSTEAVKATVGLNVRTAANQLAIGEDAMADALGEKVRKEQQRLADEEQSRAVERAKTNDHTKFGESELEKDLSVNPNPSSETVAEERRKAEQKAAKKAPAKKAAAKKTAKKAAKKASPRKATAKRSAKKR